MVAKHLAGVKDGEGKLTDTGYKRDVFTLCTTLGKEKHWSDLVPFMTSRTMRFEVVDEDGWKARLSELRFASKLWLYEPHLKTSIGRDA